jgi:hypothetical protein
LFRWAASIIQARDAAQPTIAQSLQPFAIGQDEVEMTAYVIREGLVREGQYGGKQESVDVKTERLQAGERVLDAAAGVRLTIYSKQTEEDEARDTGDESRCAFIAMGSACASSPSCACRGITEIPARPSWPAISHRRESA